MPLAARSEAWVCGRSLAGIAGSNSAGGTDECYVLSGRGLCVDLITCPGESYRVWCLVVCDQWQYPLHVQWVGSQRLRNKERFIKRR